MNRNDRTTDSSPHIAPVDFASASETQAELLGVVGGADALNLFRTLAHHPDLMRSWLRFGGQLLQRSSLPERDRELVVLRVAMRSGSDYEWGQHVSIARGAGLTDDEIIRIGVSTTDGNWSDLEAALLRATDELMGDYCIGESTWALLSKSYEAAQLIELTMLVGHYQMLAGMLRSVGVQTERPLPIVGEI